MRYRTIAGTNIQVSEIGFGVWTLAAGWWGDYSDDEAVAILRQARERGITFFDTAATYGFGRGETLLAKAFPGAARDGIVIATKFGYDWESAKERRTGHTEPPHRLDPDFLQRSLDNALGRLNTDRIDHWQLHNARMEHLERDDVWNFLDRVQREGKVRSIGVALGPAIGWLDEGRYSLSQRPAHTVQMIYNALELDPGRALLAAARHNGRSLLVRVPHSSGMLEGKYTKDTTFGPNDHRSHRPRSWLVNGLKKIDQLEFLKQDGRRTLGQAALRYVLRTPEVVSALPNIYGLDQIEEFAAASDCPDISDEEASRIEELFASNYGLPREVEAAQPKAASAR